MTDEELVRIERLANNATPGPWTTEKPKANDDGWATGVVIAATYGGQGIFAKNGKPARTKPTGHVYADPPGGQMPAADQAFLAAGREAVPELIAEVRRLRGELARAHEPKVPFDKFDALNPYEGGGWE